MTERIPVSFGLVGCGSHAQEVIIPTLGALGQSKCLWVADPKNLAAASASGRLGNCDTFGDWRDAVDSRMPEAIVCIATPIVHREVSEFAMQNGIPVFIEKPSCNNLEEAVRLAKIESKKCAIVQVGHNLRFSEAGCHTRQICRSNSFGKHRLLNFHLNAPGQKGDRWQVGSSLKAFLLSHLTHVIDYILFLSSVDFSVPLGIAANCVKDDVMISLSFTLSGGGLGTVTATNLGNYYDFSAVVVGEQGDRVEQRGLRAVDFFSTDLSKGWSRSWHPKNLQAGPDKSGYHDELVHFFELCRGSTVTANHSNFASSEIVYRVIDQVSAQAREA